MLDSLGSNTLEVVNFIDHGSHWSFSLSKLLTSPKKSTAFISKSASLLFFLALPFPQIPIPSVYVTIVPHSNFYLPYPSWLWVYRHISSPHMDPINHQPREPMLTALYWEDQSTLCYHLDVNGVVVSRRHGKTSYCIIGLALCLC